MEYKIIEGKGTYLLSLDVNVEIKKGWMPQGGPFYIKAADRFYQAMIKK